MHVVDELVDLRWRPRRQETDMPRKAFYAWQSDSDHSTNWHFIAEALKQKAEKALQGLLDRVVVGAKTGGWIAIRTLVMNCDRRIQESKRFISRRSAGAANIIA